MARIHELLRQLRATSPALADDIQREVDVLADRKSFGLNFERHAPEAVELPSRRVRVGDKVRAIAPRGQSPTSANRALLRVASIERSDRGRLATLVPLGPEFEGLDEAEIERIVAVDDLVVVAEFRDPIYPGLVSTGKVERGGGSQGEPGNKPYHAVISAENFHALQSLLFTHRGKVDAIYIDPPYNTGARDWKYNNDYVEGDDLYRHSKWLAFIERRLLLAKELLNPDDSVLIVTIDEKEYLRLGLLLEQVFPEARIQMATDVINPRAGVARPGAFTRTEEYVYFVLVGEQSAVVPAIQSTGEPLPERNTAPIWFSLMRTGSNSARRDRPNLFYPVWVRGDGSLHSVGDSTPLSVERDSVTKPGAEESLTAVWPIRPSGDENTWQLGPAALRLALAEGTARINASGSRFTINYLRTAEKKRIEAGEIEVLGKDERGALILRHKEGVVRMTAPRSVWQLGSHDAGLYGSSLLSALIPGRKFPYPKSLYATEDALRFVIGAKPEAIVVDFFSGSGTTAHAVMRLNQQDGGRRVSISITNNEVSADEQADLTKEGFRPGDPEWERWGICDYVTKPRIRAAITGTTPDGRDVAGDYKFAHEAPMADGFEENVEFFTLTYETPMRVQSNREFSRIAPFLWLRAGSRGRRIDSLVNGWDVTDAYGVLEDLDRTDEFLEAMNSAPDARIAYIVTDEDRLFEAVTRDLPIGVEPVRMYQSYLSNFEIDAMRRVR